MLGAKQLREMVDVGIALTTEKKRERLLSLILAKAMELSNCDAGTLYLYKDNALEFKIMKTYSQDISQGENGEKIDLPPVEMTEDNVCSYAAIHRELVNVKNVYDNTKFDFSGPRKYDRITGYCTKSLLVLPMEDMDGNLIGVIQLINAMDFAGNVIEFSEDSEFVLRSLASQAAVAVANMIYVDEIKQMLHSFVNAFATAVDERTPYNGSHTRKVTKYAGLLADYINELHKQGKCEIFFDENQKEQLELAAQLHDIGKLIVPLSVMNKATRLDKQLQTVLTNFELLRSWKEIDYLKGTISFDEYEADKTYIEEAAAFVQEIDGAGFLDDDKIERVREIGKKYYIRENGEKVPYLTSEQTECLCIRKGTLTEEERKQMEGHVTMTEKILNKVHFNANYSNVVKFASQHHEYLDGSGYPNHLKAAELSMETRIITVVDVFDALTSSDRPYKKPIPLPKAFAILYSMAEEGKMEERLVRWLEEAIEKYGIDAVKEEE